jgi:hypothetical protein
MDIARQVAGCMSRSRKWGGIYRFNRDELVLQRQAGANALDVDVPALCDIIEQLEAQAEQASPHDCRAAYVCRQVSR